MGGGGLQLPGGHPAAVGHSGHRQPGERRRGPGSEAQEVRVLHVRAEVHPEEPLARAHVHPHGETVQMQRVWEELLPRQPGRPPRLPEPGGRRVHHGGPPEHGALCRGRRQQPDGGDVLGLLEALQV